MSYQVGPHILYSRNATQLAQFLSEILELDIFPNASDKGKILLKNELISFEVIQADGSNLLARNSERDSIFCFRMNELSELEDLLYKVQFMSYRSGDGDPSETSEAHNKAKLHQLEEEHFFFLKDLDGRRWKFSFFS